jgi:HSP20 family protein
MGIMDKVSALLPFRGERQESPPAQAEALSLRDDLDRWLQRLFEDPWGFPPLTEGRWRPSVDVRETDDELVVTADVPGFDRDDLELALTAEGLVIRGQKREEKKDRRKDGYVTEARYGSLVQVVPLPPGLDLDRAEARVRNGVLTVRFPRAGGRPGARRIPIRT